MFRKLLFTLLLLTVMPQADEAPFIFQQIDFATARSQAKQQGRWLLVDATASWCGPCHKMDRTTWIDPEVRALVQKNLVAIQIDVDQQKELARELQIRAMPTVIIFNADGELDRIVGYRTASEFLQWMDDLSRGKSETDRLREQAATGDLEARYDLAGYVLNSGKLDEATNLFMDLWDKMRDSSWTGVRYSYLLADIGRLAQSSPVAREKFEAIRAKAKEEQQSADWFYLSKALGHDDELLAWQPGQMPAELQETYFNFLIEHQQLARAGGLVGDPAAEAEHALKRRDRIISEAADLEDDLRGLTESYAKRSTREKLLNLYAACLAAGRNDEAQAVRRIALQDDPGIENDFEMVEGKIKGQ